MHRLILGPSTLTYITLYIPYIIYIIIIISWCWTGSCGGGLPAGASLVGALETSLRSLSFSFSL